MNFLKNAASAVITCAPIASECGRNRYAGAGACMNEVAVANINTNMRSTRFICGKENQIAGTKLAHGNLTAGVKLAVSHTRQIYTCSCECILSKAGAVETIRSSSAKYIWSIPLYMPVAIKMLFSKKRLNMDDALIQKLKVMKEDIRLMKMYNMMTVL